MIRPDKAVLYTLIWTFNRNLVLTSGQSPKRKGACLNSYGSTACIYVGGVFHTLHATFACDYLDFLVSVRRPRFLVTRRRPTACIILPVVTLFTFYTFTDRHLLSHPATPQYDQIVTFIF